MEETKTETMKNPTLYEYDTFLRWLENNDGRLIDRRLVPEFTGRTYTDGSKEMDIAYEVDYVI